MKRLLLILGSVVGIGYVLHSTGADARGQAAPAGPRGELVHVVSFKFKPEATADKIKQVEDAFRALKGKIAVIMSYEWGTNVSPEKLDKGFTHAFVLTFKDAKDRDAYLVHPDHQEFGKLVGGVLADVFVVDFQARR